MITAFIHSLNPFHSKAALQLAVWVNFKEQTCFETSYFPFYCLGAEVPKGSKLLQNETLSNVWSQKPCWCCLKLKLSRTCKFWFSFHTPGSSCSSPQVLCSINRNSEIRTFPLPFPSLLCFDHLIICSRQDTIFLRKGGPFFFLISPTITQKINQWKFKFQSSYQNHSVGVITKYICLSVPMLSKLLTNVGSSSQNLRVYLKMATYKSRF